MIRKLTPYLSVGFRWPRTSGDDPRTVDLKLQNWELAPHERG